LQLLKAHILFKNRFVAINNLKFMIRKIIELKKVPIHSLLINSSFLIALFLSSCGTYNKLVYFQNGDNTEGKFSGESYTPVFQSDDLLSILIMSENSKDAEPFNLPVSFTSLSKSNNGYYNGIPSSGGYLIDSLGNISLPILGKIKVGGLNRMEATDLILKKLDDYLVNPAVQISILNFKITVLGDVRSAGTFKIPNERITILEALGLAGDLNITGNRKNILVIRNEGHTENNYRIDLTSNEMFTSPVYHLNQNDVVYVEPNRSKRLASTVGLKVGSLAVSLSSVVLTLIVLITD
jgi:polysaccharide export outer membrane protein